MTHLKKTPGRFSQLKTENGSQTGSETSTRDICQKINEQSAMVSTISFGCRYFLHEDTLNQDKKRLSEIKGVELLMSCFIVEIIVGYIL